MTFQEGKWKKETLIFIMFFVEIFFALLSLWKDKKRHSLHFIGQLLKKLLVCMYLRVNLIRLN